MMSPPPPDKTTPKPALTAGFTLIELSVVLVIIGLIVGGVLVGQNLIQSAALRATLTQIQKFTVAVKTFEAKYGCLPGDCASAANFGFYNASTGLGNNGNGDGFVTQYTWGTQFVSPEWVNFWYHLQVAGLIDFSVGGSMPSGANSVQAITTTMPPTKLNSNVYIIATGFNNNGGASNGWVVAPTNGYFLGTPANYSGQAIFNAALTPLQAYSIDQKLDDGLPYSGNVVRASEWLGANACASSSCGYVGGNCVVTVSGVLQYNNAISGPQCNLAFLNQY